MIVRAKRNTNYTMMSNVGLNDERLSLKAKGMLAHLLSKPDNWNVSDRQLCTIGPDGRAAVQAALKELETCGYLLRERVRNEDGTFTWVSTVYDEPRLGYPATVQPATVQPATVQPATVQPATDNRAIINTVGTRTVRTSTVGTNTVEEIPLAVPTGAHHKRASSPAHPNTQPIMETYINSLGYKPGNYAAEAKAAKQLATSGYVPDDIAAAYDLLKAQPFWASRHLSLQTLVKEIPAMQHALLRGVPVHGQRMNKGEQQIAAVDEAFRIMRERGMVFDES
jgi:hypothetical protein